MVSTLQHRFFGLVCHYQVGIREVNIGIDECTMYQGRVYPL